MLFAIAPRLYPRWLRWRLMLALRRTQREMGARLVPVLEQATVAMQEWLRFVSATATSSPPSSDQEDAGA